ncbi:hypothetical protein G3I60_04260 [Streptomyces sp. SID13666]|uniref:hypothetical protein n=1 Tax=Streptomyces TaxID=1883 RepID=UPI0011058A2F|nr:MULTISPECIES: hypothetical protein [Streptomyces]MCZ4096887.1 hypothetical protein [Streptomyces sp. H39-C1]NEA53395.1 hypothetical protein [Streptomyces sp. SID13666]NEA69279.1 hypothetical protein [Streptomyces sp. SID13588]QNA70735.1 hypothetical protein C8250_001155 [Streptomyces sp. So13.3]
MSVATASLALGSLVGTASATTPANPVSKSPVSTVASAPTSAPPNTSAPRPGSRITYNPKAKPGSWANPIIAKERSGLASGCGDAGLYWCKAWTAGPGWFKLGTALGSDHHEWAFTQGISQHYYEVYMDRTWDGGTHWDGRLSVVTNELRWSDAIFDGPPFKTRACLWDMTDVILYCSPSWH